VFRMKYFFHNPISSDVLRCALVTCTLFASSCFANTITCAEAAAGGNAQLAESHALCLQQYPDGPCGLPTYFCARVPDTLCGLALYIGGEGGSAYVSGYPNPGCVVPPPPEEDPPPDPDVPPEEEPTGGPPPCPDGSETCCPG